MLPLCAPPDDLLKVAGTLRAGVDACETVNELESVLALLAGGLVWELRSEHVEQGPGGAPQVFPANIIIDHNCKFKELCVSIHVCLCCHAHFLTSFRGCLF